ncbi:YbaK/EbsC family protein [Rhodococcus sp. H36-A4]|uniref:YbaK/EbsC family protein n=1 Tax=Rhodococcus sp. H36-A4 TaxID=3004353 RepID=UPI0022B02F0A|nr:YbaK/EbsC family protein [Rhodococcus sp. H36-A4]MCZ4077921.1 YbaK/EbsC family protein [Rhodococcus sp. H36-A4]
MHRLLHPNAAHVADVLISRGHHGVVVTAPVPTVTADAAAESLGVDVGAIVKSLVFLLDDDPVLLLVSGAHRVNLDRTGRRLEGTLSQASLDLVKHCTGQPIGGIAPVGHPTNLPTYVDEQLAEYPELWAAAGHPNTIFRTTYSELLRITAGLALSMT